MNEKTGLTDEADAYHKEGYRESITVHVWQLPYVNLSSEIHDKQIQHGLRCRHRMGGESLGISGRKANRQNKQMVGFQ